MHSSVLIQLTQLAEYIDSFTGSSLLGDKNNISQLLESGGHPLFQQVFAASLMHSVYRPRNPDNLLWLISNELTQTQLHNPNLRLSENPPTHVAGLVTVPDESFSLLVWGTCELVDHAMLKFKLTIYDSQAKLQTRDALGPYLNQVGQILEASLAPTFEMDPDLVLGEPNWSNKLRQLPEDELSAVFCQLISCVVHELPVDHHTLQLGPPLGSQWPVDVTHRQVAALLGQVVNKQLSISRIQDKAASVPGCIYLHG